MKHSLLLTLLFSFASFASNAQQVFAVEHNGVTTIHNSITAAIAAAQHGDKLYLPGGTITSSIYIDKKLHIYGAGYHVDSTRAIGRTFVNSLLVFTNGSSGSTIEGIHISNDIFLGNVSTDTVTNILIKRCQYSALRRGSGSYVSDILVSENILSAILFSSGIGNLTVEKCIFLSPSTQISFSTQALFENNLFLDNGIANALNNCTSNIFKNNVFLRSGIGSFASSSGLNEFYNNLFVRDSTVIASSLSINNIFSVPTNNILLNQAGNAFQTNHDYHLKPTCPGKNAGTDGTDVGIYGTTVPFKDGGVPINPHISFKSIAGATDQNGNLNVNIRVKAQTK